MTPDQLKLADELRKVLDDKGYELRLRELSPLTEAGKRNRIERSEEVAAALRTPDARVKEALTKIEKDLGIYAQEGRKIVCEDAQAAVGRFAHCLFWDAAIHDFVRQELKGKDLACWCAIGSLCHGDTLLVLANSDPDDVRAMQDLIDHRILSAAAAKEGA